MSDVNHKSGLLGAFEARLQKHGLKSLFRYGLVGIGAAGTHAAMAMISKYALTLDPTLSNFIGFVCGAVISYTGSYYFTFESRDKHSNTLPRFIIVWLIGIFINVGLFKWAITTFELPFPVSVFLAIVITPIAQFLLLRFYAFRPKS